MSEASKIPQAPDDAGRGQAARAQRGGGERAVAAIEAAATPTALLLAGAVSAAAASALAGPAEDERAPVGAAMPAAGAEAHQSGRQADAATAAASQAAPPDSAIAPAQSPDTPAKLAAASITPVAAPDPARSADGGESSPARQTTPDMTTEAPAASATPEQIAAPAAGPAIAATGSSGPLDASATPDAVGQQPAFASIGDGLGAVMDDARQSLDATLGLAGSTLAQAERALDLIGDRISDLGSSIATTMDTIPAIILGADDGPPGTGGPLAGLFGDDGEAVPMGSAADAVSAIAEPVTATVVVPALADAIDLPALAMPKIGLAGLSYTDAPDTADGPVHGHSNLLHGLF